jgi:hypothetical protein
MRLPAQRKRITPSENNNKAGGTTLGIPLFLQQRLDYTARELGYTNWSEYARKLLIEGLEQDSQLAGMTISRQVFEQLKKEFEENRTKLIKQDLRTLGQYIQFRLGQITQQPDKPVKSETE